MKVLYFDCFSGISGDMTLGALLDLGLDSEYLINQLKTLNVDGWDLKIEKRVKNGITANYVKVILSHEHENEHEHSHEHNHEHKHHPEHSHEHNHEHRSYTNIITLIDNSGITENAKNLAKAIFKRVAVAEAKVHGQTVENVHFHEVGAVDSIIDIVGTAVLIDLIKPDKIESSVVNDGYGFTYCQHGKIPVPVPAVVEIFSDPKVKTRQIDIPKELVTPTGAAIIAELSESFCIMSDLTIKKTGYGAGTRDLEIPNILRVILCEKQEKSEEITIIETNVDDCSPEILGYTMECLMESGARDVFFTAIQMKKNRPATKITVQCEKNNVDLITEILFRETTTIGVRIREEKRICLPRKDKTVTTEYGALSAKEVTLNGIKITTPEYEDAKRLAKEKNIPLKNIYKSFGGF